jgi:uncharacterized protein
MDDSRKHIPFNQSSPYFQLFVTFILVMIVGMVIGIIVILLGALIFGSNIEILNNPLLATGGKDIAFLKFYLMIQTATVFLVPAVILIRKMKPEGEVGYPEFRVPQLNEIVLVVILTFCLFVVTGFAGEINSLLNLPEWLSGLEQWIVKMEEDSDHLMKQILAPVGFAGLALNVFMIAVLPAIGEEMLFRGVLQKIFGRIFKSGHTAVWVTAILFSALHFEFLGFLPRLILGLVFGYLYLWSGKLWLSILAHFVNNAVPTIAAFIFGYEDIMNDVAPELWKQVLVLPIPATIIFVILFYMRNSNRQVSVVSN